MSAQPLHIWTASPRAFAMRTAGMFVVTFMLLTPAWFFLGGLKTLAISACLSLVYMFVLDDFAEWRKHSKTKWTLTASHLIYENPVEDMAAHSLALSQIISVRVRFLWSIVITIEGGQAITMAYIDAPRDARDIIMRAQADALQT